MKPYNQSAIVNVLHICRHLSPAAALLAFALVSPQIISQAKSVPPATDLDTAVLPTASPQTHRCSPEDYSILDLPETKALISEYDFEPFLPGKCIKAEIPWAKTAIVIRLDAVTTQTDDNRELTLLRASPTSRVWLVPIIHGMVGYAHTPDNPHNLAALNDLLRTATYKPTDDQIPDISNLYQFIVGAEVWIDPKRAPKSLKQALSVNDIEGQLDRDNGLIDYTHRERFGDAWTRSYMVWEFRYATDGEYTRLVEVERKTLKEFNE